MMQFIVVVSLVALLFLVTQWLGARAQVAELQLSIKALKRRLNERR